MAEHDCPICRLCGRHPVVNEFDVWCDRCVTIAADARADSHVSA